VGLREGKRADSSDYAADFRGTALWRLRLFLTNTNFNTGIMLKFLTKSTIFPRLPLPLYKIQTPDFRPIIIVCVLNIF
jgi:hypothetical protein